MNNKKVLEIIHGYHNNAILIFEAECLKGKISQQNI